MHTFANKGPENTQTTLKLALEKANELQTSLVIATNTGQSVQGLLDLMKEMQIERPVIAVSHVYGMREPGKNELTDEMRAYLENRGVVIVTAAHALSGAERAFSNRFKGQGPIEIMAHTLRMFSQGVKVAVEISTMALDAGRIPYGKPVVAIGGSGSGQDSAVVLTPSYTHCILDTKIHEILCKPYTG